MWVGLNTRVDWDNVTITGPVYLGSSVKVEAGATIVGPTWIGHGSHVRRGATVKRSVLFEYTRIGENMEFAEMIVSPDYCVDNKGDTRYRGDDNCLLRWSDARG